MDTKQLILQIIVAVISGAIIPTIINYFANKKKSKADATDVLTGSALKLVTGIQNELERTKKELHSLECDIANLRVQLADKELRIRTLEAQLVEKDSKIRDLQIALSEKNGRVDALEKRIKELEEAEQRHTQYEKGSTTQ